MSRVDELIASRAVASLADVLESGPRFWSGRQTSFAARCPTGKHVSAMIDEEWFYLVIFPVLIPLCLWVANKTYGGPMPWDT